MAEYRAEAAVSPGKMLVAVRANDWRSCRQTGAAVVVRRKPTAPIAINPMKAS